MNSRHPDSGEIIPRTNQPTAGPREPGRAPGWPEYRGHRGDFSSDQFDEEKNLRYYLDIIFRRIVLVVIVFSLIFAAALIYTFTRPPVFRSVATLEYQGLRPQGDDLGVRQFTNFFGFERYLQTQVKILRSRELARAVAIAVEPKLPKDPTEQPKGMLMRIREALLGSSESDQRPEASQQSGDQVKGLFWRIVDPIRALIAPKPREVEPLTPEQEKARRIAALTQFIQGSVRPTILKGSNVVRVSIQGHDPALTQMVLQKHIELYLSRNIESIRQEGQEVLVWLKQELANVTDKLMQSEKALISFVGQHGIVTSQDGGFAQVMSMLDKTMTSLMESRQTRTKLQALNDRRSQKGADPYSSSAKNEYIKKLKQTLASLEAEEAEMSGVYSTSYPKRALLMKKIALLKKRLAEIADQTATSALDMAQREETALEDMWKGMKKEAMRVNALGAEYALLKKKVETNRELHKIILKESKEAEIRARTAVNNIRTLDPPTAGRIGPSHSKYLLFGTLLAFMGGILVAFVADFLDDSVQNTNRIEQEFNLKRLGIVPDVTRLKREHKIRRSDAPLEFVAHHHPKSPMSDAIRNVQSSIFLSVPREQVQSMIVSSAVPKEGKTLIAVSLATVLVANNSKRALIVDCDLRKPRIHKIFHRSPSRPGLANLLGNTGPEVALEDVIHSHEIPGLFYMTAGPVPPDPVSLLSSPRFESVVEGLKKRFDFIVFDSPPLLLFPDARLLTRHADGVMLVARQGFVKQDEFRAATELIATTPGGEILGIVLNKTRRRGFGYKSYGGYYYYRRYDYYGTS